MRQTLPFLRYAGLGFLLSSGATPALESLELHIGTIGRNGWKLRDTLVSLSRLSQTEPELALRSAFITLPAPFDRLSGLHIKCRQFSWGDTHIECRQGQGRITSDAFQSPVFDLTFTVRNGAGSVAIRNLPLLDGLFSLDAHEQAGAWRARIKGKGVQLQRLRSLLKDDQIQALKGAADVDMALRATPERLELVRINTRLSNLNMQAFQDRVASENLSVNLAMKATAINNGWHWQVDSRVVHGAGYIDPVYLAVQADQPVTLLAGGRWMPEKSVIDVHFAELQHEGVGRLSGDGTLELRPALRVRRARMRARTASLDKAAPIYVNPFLEAGAWTNLKLSGGMAARLGIEDNLPVSLQLDFTDLNLADSGHKLSMSDAFGQINWRAASRPVADSHVQWRKLQLNAIPFSRGQVDFSVSGKQLTLRNKARLKVLDGLLSIDAFHFSAGDGEDADVRFVGALDRLSLTRLSAALGWAPLSGSISGEIPAVTYRNKKLELSGALTMQVFDGDITVRRLASSGLFTDFSQFYADIELNNLDLNAVTRQFQFGTIEGRLSGYIRDLYLENWRPVSFYAWLGTPDNDPSRHRISQKAVENIASIGGGGAADAISRGFMSLFDTFSYDSLGFGCYLHRGVCQMMGVMAAKNGYYLVKGGGLPRIDVIGYNPRLDWNVLLQRLRRITATDPAVVE